MTCASKNILAFKNYKQNGIGNSYGHISHVAIADMDKTIVGIQSEEIAMNYHWLKIYMANTHGQGKFSIAYIYYTTKQL